MADAVDRGNEQAEYLLAVALHKRAAAGRTGVSAEFCEDCGEPIPAKRREMVKGCVTCVECQGLREVRHG